MTLKFEIKRFNELSLDDLYTSLQLRSEIFVVEQDCVYQDIDGKDQKALHLMGTFNGELVAYCRLFQPDDYFPNAASIGRVVVKQSYRDRKWGHDLIREAKNGIQAHFGTDTITISAQLYLKRFYESHGFVQVSDEYLEDNIPHIEMRIK
ncbi:GNAT family N-acetyltransferase [Flavobacterium supellecticarium]|uniref:GNAT family N-acetyltransferase n=1 Tax=Flavobacterium supellecticarium TaxID=2565924 RepID=A0A4V3W7K2_9FLAO|nr:GNAT family N-acetyltransferase [Flavobacterium supellecticarium]THF47690.1 GNAT family N-acetyltransferase [Flavobacterium supellecticarium]